MQLNTYPSTRTTQIQIVDDIADTDTRTMERLPMFIIVLQCLVLTVTVALAKMTGQGTFSGFENILVAMGIVIRPSISRERLFDA